MVWWGQQLCHYGNWNNHLCINVNQINSLEECYRWQVHSSTKSWFLIASIIISTWNENIIVIKLATTILANFDKVHNLQLSFLFLPNFQCMFFGRFFCVFVCLFACWYVCDGVSPVFPSLGTNLDEYELMTPARFCQRDIDLTWCVIHLACAIYVFNYEYW